MRAITPRIWNETDVPAVAAADLSEALSLWLARERQGPVLVGEAPVATIDTIEADVIEMFEADPSRGLSVLFRLRGLITALTSRRWRHLVRGSDGDMLTRIAAVAAGQRLNANWGFSPVRLAWGIAAAQTVTVTANVQLAA